MIPLLPKPPNPLLPKPSSPPRQRPLRTLLRNRNKPPKPPQPSRPPGPKKPRIPVEEEVSIPPHPTRAFLPLPPLEEPQAAPGPTSTCHPSNLDQTPSQQAQGSVAASSAGFGLPPGPKPLPVPALIFSSDRCPCRRGWNVGCGHNPAFNFRTEHPSNFASIWQENLAWAVGFGHWGPLGSNQEGSVSPTTRAAQYADWIESLPQQDLRPIAERIPEGEYLPSWCSLERYARETPQSPFQTTLHTPEPAISSTAEPQSAQSPAREQDEQNISPQPHPEPASKALPFDFEFDIPDFGLNPFEALSPDTLRWYHLTPEPSQLVFCSKCSAIIDQPDQPDQSDPANSSPCAPEFSFQELLSGEFPTTFDSGSATPVASAAPVSAAPEEPLCSDCAAATPRAPNQSEEDEGEAHYRRLRIPTLSEDPEIEPDVDGASDQSEEDEAEARYRRLRIPTLSEDPEIEPDVDDGTASSSEDETQESPAEPGEDFEPSNPDPITPSTLADYLQRLGQSSPETSALPEETHPQSLSSRTSFRSLGSARDSSPPLLQRRLELSPTDTFIFSQDDWSSFNPVQPQLQYPGHQEPQATTFSEEVPEQHQNPQVDSERASEPSSELLSELVPPGGTFAPPAHLNTNVPDTIGVNVQGNWEQPSETQVNVQGTWEESSETQFAPPPRPDASAERRKPAVSDLRGSATGKQSASAKKKAKARAKAKAKRNNRAVTPESTITVEPLSSLPHPSVQDFESSSFPEPRIGSSSSGGSAVQLPTAEQESCLSQTSTPYTLQQRPSQRLASDQQAIPQEEFRQHVDEQEAFDPKFLAQFRQVAEQEASTRRSVSQQQLSQQSVFFQRPFVEQSFLPQQSTLQGGFLLQASLQQKSLELSSQQQASQQASHQAPQQIPQQQTIQPRASQQASQPQVTQRQPQQSSYQTLAPRPSASAQEEYQKRIFQQLSYHQRQYQQLALQHSAYQLSLFQNQGQVPPVPTFQPSLSQQLTPLNHPYNQTAGQTLLGSASSVTYQAYPTGPLSGPTGLSWLPLVPAPTAESARSSTQPYSQGANLPSQQGADARFQGWST